MTDSQAADRKKELQGVLSEKVASNKEIADSFEVDEKGTVHIEAEHKQAFDANMKDIREIRSLLADLDEQEKADRYLSGSDDESYGFAGQVAQKDSRSLGQMFLDSPEFKELQNGRNGANMRTPFEIKRANLGNMWRQKDVYTDLPTGTPGSFGTTQVDPIVDNAKRQTRVRDLFPVQNTTANVIEYFRVTGFSAASTTPDNAASTVGEYSGSAFVAKPQTELAFTGHQSPVRTIAHWEAAHRNVLADEPQLRGIIDNELLYGLRLEEDNQILNGSGSGDDLEGILNTTDIQSYSWSSGATAPVSDNKADALRRAATLAFLSYYQPTGVVLHPNDWEDIELVKDTNGQYLMAVSIAIGGEPMVWRMPVVDTPAIAEGTALLGSFGIGAQLYDREQANVRIAEQHSDFFVRNAVVVLAEERLAMAVKRPESFVEVTFDAAP